MPWWRLGGDERWVLAWSPLFVAAASAAGLGAGIGMFGLVWMANLWADLLFYVGTIVAILLTFRASERAGGFTWLIAPMCHLVVYLISAPLMLGNLGDVADWTPARFFLPVTHQTVHMQLVFIWGWPGLVMHALFGLALDLDGRASRRH